MRTVGIDIGSRTIKLAVWDDGKIVEIRHDDTGFDPLTRARRLLEGVARDRIMATGYGRNLLEIALDAPTVTEIKAHAAGARHHFPQARTVLDIGGQDSKAIAMNASGKVVKFEMNDRCAAGTGKFLEHLANVFQMPIEKFGAYALRGDTRLAINSMCTVFAETEATSLMGRGERPENIALGIHDAIVRRTANMLARVGFEAPCVFAGGVAHNPCVVALLAESLGTSPVIPAAPDQVGALGAALHGLGG